jgi:hypothetical protein
MGQALLRLTADDPSMRIAAAASQTVGQRVVDGIPQFSATELENVPAFDVAIDFSMPAAFNSILALCLERGVPLVCGTTGLDDTQKSALAAASTRIATLWSSNFSLGVAVLTALAWVIPPGSTPHARGLQRSADAVGTGSVLAGRCQIGESGRDGILPATSPRCQQDARQRDAQQLAVSG